MSQITIPDIASDVQYHLSSSTSGVFTVPFPFFERSDVKCRVVDAAGVITELTYLSGFTFDYVTTPVGQIGNGFEGGGILLSSPIGADGNTDLTIYRDQAIDRTANFPSTGLFTVSVLNDEQNSFIMMLRQVWDRVWQRDASTSTRPSINIPQGVQPNNPLHGDVWVTANDFLARINGVDYSLISGVGGGGGDVTKVGTPSINEVGVWTGDGTLGSSNRLEFDGTELKVEPLSGNAAQLMLSELGATADEGKWRLEAFGDALAIKFVNDAESIASTGVLMNRTGTTPDAMTLFLRLVTDASTSGNAGFNIPEGVAPSAPVDGDVWITAAGAFNARLNGATVDLSAVSSGDVTKVGTPANTEVAHWTGDGTIQGDSSWTYGTGNKTQYQFVGGWTGYDNVSLILGTGADITMVSDGTDINFTLGAGVDWKLMGDVENAITYNANSTVDLYWNGLLRIQTGQIGTWTFGSSMLQEQAFAGSGAAGWGQLWVRNDAPNNLAFTSDASITEDLTGVNAGRRQRKVKTADETISEVSTLQEDNHLNSFFLFANTRYSFSVFLHVTTTNNTPDMALALAFDSAPIGGVKFLRYGESSVLNGNSSDSITGGQFASVVTGVANIVKLDGFFETNAATNMDLVWSQNLSWAADTVVKQGSYMIVEQLS